MIYDEEGLDINLAICQSFYMDKLGVQRSYESCNMQSKYAPQHWIAADGVYTFFKFRNRSTPDLSDDGSREYIEKQPKVTLIDYPGYQQDKRTAYINKAVEYGCDAIIVIDSDEYLHPDYRNWREFRRWLVRYARSYDPAKQGIIFNLYSWIDKDYIKAYNTTEVEQFTLVPRVWHSPKNLEYYQGVHYWVRRKSNEDIPEHLEQTHLVIEYGIRLAQDSKLRNPDFNDARDNWAKAGIYHEDVLRKKYAQAHNLPYVSIYNRVFGVGDSNILGNLNPLVVSILNRYNNDTIENIKRMINVDKLFLEGYKSMKEALNDARNFFLKNPQYSHMVITRDKFKPRRTDLNLILQHLAKGYYHIVGAWSDLGKTTTFSTANLDLAKPLCVTKEDMREIELNDDRLMEVKFTEFVLLGINKRILERIEFDSYPERDFCWDVVNENEHIMIDPDIKVEMDPKLPIELKHWLSTMFLEKRYVDIDSFMA